MKKIGFLLAIAFSFIVGRQFTNAEDFYYKDEGILNAETIKSDDRTDLGKIIKTENISLDGKKDDNTNSLLYKIRGFFKLNSDVYKERPAIAYIQMLINMALGLVSFISLILIMFAFYLILFDKGEDGVKKAKAVIKGVAIAIALIGLSRLIVSFFFNLYTTEVV